MFANIRHFRGSILRAWDKLWQKAFHIPKTLRFPLLLSKAVRTKLLACPNESHIPFLQNEQLLRATNIWQTYAEQFCMTDNVKNWPTMWHYLITHQWSANKRSIFNINPKGNITLPDWWVPAPVIAQQSTKVLLVQWWAHLQRIAGAA